MYKDQIIIDGLQYCNWTRDYFKTLQKSGITAVHVTLVYHEMARETAEDIAAQAVDSYIRKHQQSANRFYGMALAASVGVFTIGIAFLSGMFS